MAQELNQQGFSTASLAGPQGSVLFADIPPLLRLLLVTDGTVTKALEAYFNSAVQVHLIGQGREPSRAGVFDKINLVSKDLMYREVHLVKRVNHTVLAQAESIIALDRLPADLAESLLAGRFGIGELIRSQGLDTYRQLCDLGICERNAVLGVWRRYEICQQGTALIQVQEWFPWELHTFN